MKSTTALPPKATKSICSDCGLVASRPIVVPLGVRNDGGLGAKQLGRCANRRACARRQLRTSNKAKQAKV